MNEKREEPKLSWEPMAAFVCFVGSVISLALGFALTTNWVLNANRHPFLHGVGLTLLIIGIPLLILGGHCLDLMERRVKKSRPQLDAHGNRGTKSLHVGVVLLGSLLVLCAAFTKLNAQQITPVESGDTTRGATELNPGKSPDIGVLSAPLLNLSGEKRLLFQHVDVPNGKVPKSDIKVRDTYTNDSNNTLDAAPARFGDVRQTVSEDPPPAPSQLKWQYGGFIDLGYLLDFNHPANRLFRSRGTTFHVDRVQLNIAGVYARKKATEESRWGVELTAHGGKDSEVFGFSATAPNMLGFKFLRHLGPTNVSYLAPVGKGLALQAGIFTSLIGYDSLYAKDNFNYTRPWGADFTPYLMMGVNGSYPISEKLTGSFFVVNGYWHLARANNVPSSGGQLAYKINPRVTLKQTALLGPHQANKSFKFWRFLSDTIIERKVDRLTYAFEYTASWERVDAPGNLRALMMSSQFPVRWTLNKHWALAVRPEVFWDRDGRWTLARQTVKALTSTLEYRIPYQWSNTILRLEHRWDDSRGRDGGFFRGREVAPGVVGLTPSQHLLIFGLMFTVDR